MYLYCLYQIRAHILLSTTNAIDIGIDIMIKKGKVRNTNESEKRIIFLVLFIVHLSRNFIFAFNTLKDDLES